MANSVGYEHNDILMRAVYFNTPRSEATKERFSNGDAKDDLCTSWKSGLGSEIF